jgi:HlyD family secretion protein
MAPNDVSAAPAASPRPLDALGARGRDTPHGRARERKRALGRGIRRALLGLLAVAAVIGVVLALRPRPAVVDAARASRGPLVVAVEESGMTRVKDRYVVSAPVSGSVSRVALEPGDAVKEGDVLAVMFPALSPLLDERTRAEAEGRLSASLSAEGQTRAVAARATVAKELADQELLRVQRLAASGSVSQQALDLAAFEARMRVQEVSSAAFATKVAAEEVRIARSALGRGGERAARDHHVDVIAPISGRVLRVHQKSASVIPTGAVLVEVGDPTALEIVVDLLTTDAIRIEPGTPATIEGWGGDHPLAGRVRRVEPSAFTRPSALGVDEQRVNVIIALTDPRETWAALADGYRVEARLVLWRGEDVLKVPQGAVFRHGDGWAVFRIDGGVARLAAVSLGHRGESEVEILSGLTPGSEVAVHPGDRVKDGVRVEVR